MDNWKQYFHQPKKIEELIDGAIIVVDTNVLLSAYQWRNVTLDEVLRILNALNEEDRLVIPFQVVKEFSKNRPDILKERLNEIEVTINSLQKQKPLNERVPMLEGHQVYLDTEKLLKDYNNALNAYKSGLIKIRDKIKELFTYDPYLERLEKILEKAYYFPEEVKDNFEKLSGMAKERFDKKQPPGYKDNPKEENSEGDFIIWYTILQLKKDVVFISNDKKADWVYRDKHEESISARRELVEEFYRETNGKDFVRLSPKEFISIYNPNVSEVVKKDLTMPQLSFNYFSNLSNLSNELLQDNIEKINDILISYDPLGVIFEFDFQQDEYMTAAKEIIKIYNSKNEKKRSKVIEYLESMNREKLRMPTNEIIDMLEEIEANIKYSKQTHFDFFPVMFKDGSEE